MTINVDNIRDLHISRDEQLVTITLTSDKKWEAVYIVLPLEEVTKLKDLLDEYRL